MTGAELDRLEARFQAGSIITADEFLGLIAAAREPAGAGLDAKTVGRVVDEHYRARLAADPTGPRLHECGSYCGADIAARLAALSGPKP